MDDCESTTSTDESLEQRAPLKREVLRLISRYRTNAEKPPFEAQEMVTMAVICSDEYELNRMDVLDFIIKSFAYYGLRVLEDYIRAGRSRHEWWEDDLQQHEGCIVENFFEAFRSYGMPFLEHDADDEIFAVDLRAARIFLSRHLAPARKGVFDFLGLPSELRNDIYERVLAIPDHWIKISSNTCRASRDTLDASISEDDGDTLLPSSADMLSLLSVCKQIHKEAVPLFYRLNSFILEGGIGRFRRIGRGMAAERFQSLTRLRLKVAPTSNFAACARMLANHRPFSELILDIRDNGWMIVPWWVRGKDFTRTMKLKMLKQKPGLRSLARAAHKAEKFVIQGKCPAMKAFVDQEVVALEASEKDTTSSRKSKATTAENALDH